MVEMEQRPIQAHEVPHQCFQCPGERNILAAPAMETLVDPSDCVEGFTGENDDSTTGRTYIWGSPHLPRLGVDSFHESLRRALVEPSDPAMRDAPTLLVVECRNCVPQGLGRVDVGISVSDYQRRPMGASYGVIDSGACTPFAEGVTDQ
jgi:hypothetical protein